MFPRRTAYKHSVTCLYDVYISVQCVHFADTYAMAAMALQCVKDSGAHVHNAAELDTALSKIKQKLLAGQRPDGHMGNEFSTGLAVQVRTFSFHENANNI